MNVWRIGAIDVARWVLDCYLDAPLSLVEVAKDTVAAYERGEYREVPYEEYEAVRRGGDQ